MPDLRARLERYLHDALGIVATLAPWDKEGGIPLFLQDRYRFLNGKLMNLRCLFMVDQREQEETPAAIRRHIDMVRNKWDGPVIYLRERITAYHRQRLIGQKVPFVVPGNQMYLPMLGIDLREHFRKLRQDQASLGPAAQAVLIHALLCTTAELCPTALAKHLGYSIMSMSRALDELDTAGLGHATTTGRKRHLRLAGPKLEVWEKAQPLLRSPVVRRNAIRLAPQTKLPGPRAGLDALAHYSLLAEPENLAVALDREDWKTLQANGVETAMADEPEATIIEVWSYPPTLFAAEGWVDRLSLFLSLRETQDERVQATLEQMLKEVSW